MYLRFEVRSYPTFPCNPPILIYNYNITLSSLEYWNPEDIKNYRSLNKKFYRVKNDKEMGDQFWKINFLPSAYYSKCTFTEVISGGTHHLQNFHCNTILDFMVG